MPEKHFPFSAAVKTLQLSLTAHGFPCGVVDGLFGLKTAQALDKALRAGAPLIETVEVARKEIRHLVPKQRDIRAFYGAFTWMDELDPARKGGVVVITKEWKENLVTVDFPLPGLVDKDPVHTRVAGIFWAALAEVVRYNEAHLEEAYWPKVFGTYCPRHMSWDVKQGLSTHSWGVAADIDPKTNKMGDKTWAIPEWFFEIFRAWGFTCGRDWKGKKRDPMHAQLAFV